MAEKRVKKKEKENQRKGISEEEARFIFVVWNEPKESEATV